MGWCERTGVFNMDPVLLALPVTLVSCVKGFCIDTLIRIWSHYPRGNTTMVNLVFIFYGVYLVFLSKSNCRCSVLSQKQSFFHQLCSMLWGENRERQPWFYRWMKSAMSMQCVYIVLPKPEFYTFRRLQMSQQQALRQQKNYLQQCLIFHSHAVRLQDRHGMGRTNLLSRAWWFLPNHFLLDVATLLSVLKTLVDIFYW